MKLLKLLVAISMLANFNAAWSQEDSAEDGWSDDTVAPMVTPVQSEDAAGEEEMPVYDETADY